MKDTALFAQLLGLLQPWQVTEVTPDLNAKSITIRISWPEGLAVPCPEWYVRLKTLPLKT